MNWACRAAVILGALGSPGSPQEESASCRILGWEEKRGEIHVRYGTSFSPGSEVSVEVAEFRCRLFWDLSPSRSAEDLRKSVGIYPDSAKVFAGRATVSRDGGFSHPLGSIRPGVYRVEVTFDPRAQRRPSPGSDAPRRTTHRMILYRQGMIADQMIEDAREAMEFAGRFLEAARGAIQEGGGDAQIARRMVPFQTAAIERARREIHGGFYWLMTELSSFMHLKPSSEGEAGYDPDALEINRKPMPAACLREGLVHCLEIAGDCLVEGRELSSSPESVERIARWRTLSLLVEELKKAVGALPKMEKTGSVAAAVRAQEILAILAEVEEALARGKEGRAVEEEEKLVSERVRRCRDHFCDPRNWEE